MMRFVSLSRGPFRLSLTISPKVDSASVTVKNYNSNGGLRRLGNATLRAKAAYFLQGDGNLQSSQSGLTSATGAMSPFADVGMIDSGFGEFDNLVVDRCQIIQGNAAPGCSRVIW